MEEKSNPHTHLHNKKPWSNNDNTIWLATTLKLFRNVEKFAFPSKLPEDKKKQITSLVGRSLSEVNTLSNSVVYKADELSALEKEYLLEHYLGMQSFHHMHGSESFLVDESGEFLAVINLDDHIQLQITDCLGEMEKSWNRLIAIETALGASVNYSYSPQFGFLTADPSHSGTGLSVHVFLHLPALIHTNQLHAFLQKNMVEGIAVTGLQGDPLNRIGDVVVVHNQYMLGLTEEDIISSLQGLVTKLLVAENGVRSQIKLKDDATMKDKVSRAYGVLLHSYQLEIIEAMNGLSLLKLALDLNWIEGIDSKELNMLFFNSRRAHLIAMHEKEVGPELLPHKRAELIHEHLKPAKLMI